MSPFVFVALCIQACLLQNTLGQPCPSLGQYDLANLGLARNVAINNLNYGAANSNLCRASNFGGIGNGQVEVVGELPVCGSTVVGGQVPVYGIVQFNGDVPASGCVTVSGNCRCGCRY